MARALHDRARLPHADARLPHADARLPHAGARLPHAGARVLRVELLVALLMATGVEARFVAHAAEDPARDETPTNAERTTPLADLTLPAEDPGNPAPPGEPVTQAQADVEHHLHTARMALAECHYEEALLELNAALPAARGDCYPLLMLLAQVKRETGRLGEARVAAEQALVYRPADPEAHYLVGRLLRGAGQLLPAAQHFRAATQNTGVAATHSNAVASWYELGDVLDELGYARAAADAFAEFDHLVWKVDPDLRLMAPVVDIMKQSPYGLIERRLRLLHAAGAQDECAAAAKWAAETQPDEPYLERLYVRTLLDVGRAGEAFDFCRARLDRAATSQPADSQPADDATRQAALLTMAIEAAQASDRFGGWVAQLRTNVAAGQQVDLALRLAQRLDERGDYRFSVPVWRTLAEATPDSADYAWALAGALKGAGELPAALDTLSAFVRRNPTGGEVPAERLRQWLRRLDATAEFLHLAAERSAAPDCDAAASTVLAATAAAAGQNELADRLFAQALERQADYPLAHVTWGRVLADRYDWEGARTHAKAALAAAPDLAAAHLLLADACAGLDEADAAEAAYKAALATRPDDPVYVHAIARHYRRTGNLLAAQRYFQRTWTLDHTQAEAIEELVDCYLEGGKFAVARQCLAEAEASDLPADVLRRLQTTLRFAEHPMQEDHLAELRRQFDEHPQDARTGLKLAVGLFLRDRSAEAVPVVERVRALDPDDEGGCYLAARVSLRRLDAAPAVAILEEMTRRYPHRTSTHLLLAEAYVADYQLDEARDVLRRVLGFSSLPAAQRDELRLRMLSTWLTTGTYEPALAQVDEWLKDTPDSDALIRTKLTVLLAAKRGADAIALARSQLDATEAKHQALQQKVTDTAAEAEGNIDAQARLTAEQRELETLEPTLLDRRDMYVRVCAEAGEAALALEAARDWLRAEPERAEYQACVIELLLDSGQPHDALELAGAVQPQNVADVLAIAGWRARARAAGGQLEVAVNELAALLDEPFVQATRTARSEIRRQIVVLLGENGQAEQAVARCADWLRALGERGDSAERFDVLSLQRRALLAAGREEEYIAVGEKLLALQPRDPGLNNDLGFTLVDHGQQVERAVEMIRLAVAAEPLNAAYVDSLGWAYYKQGDFGNARLWLARAAELWPAGDASVLEHLGDAEYRLGNQRAARENWARAAKLAEEDHNTPASGGATGLAGGTGAGGHDATAGDSAGLEGGKANAGAGGGERAARLIAGLRARLAALDEGTPAPVAPTAATEQP